MIPSIYVSSHAKIVPAEVLGALGAVEGRNQAFGAIRSQDFVTLLGRITYPIASVHAIGDPLAGMLDRVRADHPAIPIELIGPAECAAPKLQPDQYEARLPACEIQLTRETL